MPYYIATKRALAFNESLALTEAALSKEGFGVVSRIDIQATLKAKIGVSFRPYTILGACNPKLAYEALQLEDKVGNYAAVQLSRAGPRRRVDGNRRHRSGCLNAGN